MYNSQVLCLDQILTFKLIRFAETGFALYSALPYIFVDTFQ